MRIRPRTSNARIVILKKTAPGAPGTLALFFAPAVMVHHKDIVLKVGSVAKLPA
jgi:hypothetical protein